MSTSLPRHLEPRVRELLGFFPGVVIEGARQVGKSTLARRIAEPGALWRTLDDEQVRAAAAADPAGFVAEGRGRQMVLDEIQRIPELTLAVKAAIDRDRAAGRFILTGSSSLLRVRGPADSLAGRVAYTTLYGLSRGEVAQVGDDFIGAVRDDPSMLAEVTSTTPRSEYADLLTTGAYPSVRDASPRMRAEWIDAYLQALLVRDLPELRREVDPGRTMAILRVLAGRQSAELVKARLAADTSVPASTVTGYLDLLQEVGLVAAVPPWTPNLAKREIGRAKMIVIDSAVASRLTRLTTQQLTNLEYGEAFGSLLEGFVAAELLRQHGWSETSFEVYHYRDRDGDEVDLVIECDDGGVIGVEVKATTSFTARQFRGLTRMRDRLGERFVCGVVLNTGGQGYRYADRLYGAPVSTLWQTTATGERSGTSA